MKSSLRQLLKIRICQCHLLADTTPSVPDKVALFKTWFIKNHVFRLFAELAPSLLFLLPQINSHLWKAVICSVTFQNYTLDTSGVPTKHPKIIEVSLELPAHPCCFIILKHNYFGPPFPRKLFSNILNIFISLYINQKLSTSLYIYFIIYGFLINAANILLYIALNFVIINEKWYGKGCGRKR